jgi:hypothetical protein
MKELMTKTVRFKKNESFKHKCAVEVLAAWVNGVIEKPFYVEDKIAFVPDVSVYKNGILQCIYEVVNSHPLTALKYGMIQYYCYMNKIDLTVFEVSAEWILKQCEKPERIIPMECYIVSLMEYEEIQDELITAIN